MTLIFKELCGNMELLVNLLGYHSFRQNAGRFKFASLRLLWIHSIIELAASTPTDLLNLVICDGQYQLIAPPFHLPFSRKLGRILHGPCATESRPAVQQILRLYLQRQFSPCTRSPQTRTPTPRLAGVYLHYAINYNGAAWGGRQHKHILHITILHYNMLHHQLIWELDDNGVGPKKRYQFPVC